MLTDYMWPIQSLKLNSLLETLSTAVAVLAMECEKHVSTIPEGFLKIWNVYAAMNKTLFWDYIETLLKAK